MHLTIPYKSITFRVRRNPYILSGCLGCHEMSGFVIDLLWICQSINAKEQQESIR